MSQETITAEPPRSTLVKWARLNLAFAMAVLTLTSSGIGLIIGGTWRVSKYDQRLEALEKSQSESAPAIAKIGLIDVFTAGVAQRVGALESNQTARDKELGQMSGHVGVIDEKLMFVGKFIDANTLPIVIHQAKGYRP